MQQVQQNQKPPYFIYSVKEYFYLCCALSHLKNTDYIRIERQTCKIETLEQKQFLAQIKEAKPIEAMLIIGILILNSEIYLLFVSSAIPVFKQAKADWIYQVENVIHYPFKPPLEYRYSKNKKNNEQMLKYLQETVLKKNFYFRYKLDITLSLQNTKLYNKPTEYKFFWNQHLVRIFKQNNSHKCWRIPIMQGYVKCQNFGKECYYLMISRRSKIFCGPRLLNRGINEADGESVANFIETQQIYRVKNDTFSYVSVRGSVPVYWKQSKGYIEFKNDQKNPIGFQSHIQALQKAYPQKRIYLVSWLMKEKQELLLKQKLDICFYHSKNNYHQNDKYRMICIDIDQNNKNALYFLKQLIHKQVSMLMPYRDNFFWYTEEKGQQTIMGKQKLLYRVNCVDCTMRTNAIMTELSRKTMRDIEEILSIKKDTNEHYEGLEDIVVNRWKQLGNRVSRLYCGQDEMEVGKKQQSSFFSMFSLNKDSMGSEFKQKTLELFLSQITSKQVLWIQKNLERRLNIIQHTSITTLKFFVLTWNCNNLNPLSINDWAKERLLEFNRSKTDIVIVNLQQMVELSTYNVLVTIDEQVKSKWKQILIETLNQKIQNQLEKFDFIAEENLVAITTWVFIKNRVKVKHLQAKQSTIVKTGFANGLGGNKGAVILFLKLDSTWIAIINCHLTAGQGKKVERKQSIELILYSWIEQKFKDRLAECDISFLIGDLNFRLQWSQQEIKSVLYEAQKKFIKQNLKKDPQQELMAKHLKVLWQKDELITYMQRQDQILNKFYEQPLEFMPTYKFIKKSNVNEYDDKRSPAWCDRILYGQKISKIVNQTFYHDIDINLSDHKPVRAHFDVTIKKIQSKQDYQKKFSQAKKIYYKKKTAVNKNVSSNHQQNKVQAENVDFFNQKAIQKPKQQSLIDADHHQDKNAASNKIKGYIQAQKTESKSRSSQNSPSKNDFSQFHQIATEMQKKNSRDSKTTSQNLLDLQ